MSRFPRKNASGEAAIIVSEQKGIRFLHLGGNMIQSAMRVTAPNELELRYTQCMMGFMLFNPQPSEILMIGLGGGSLAKFVHSQLPETRTTVVEINPDIIRTAHSLFALPAPDDRLVILHADGAQHIQEHTQCADIIMVDGFDNDLQIPGLCSEEFYQQARETLTKRGILVINLLSRDKKLVTYLQRIETVFQNRVITLLSEIRGNLIVFAFKQSPGKLTWKTLIKHAHMLEQHHALPFPDFVSELHKSVKHKGDFLTI